MVVVAGGLVESIGGVGVRVDALNASGVIGHGTGHAHGGKGELFLCGWDGLGQVLCPIGGNEGIVIEEDHVVALDLIERGIAGGGKPLVFGEGDDFDVVVLGDQVVEISGGLVRGSIIHDEELEILGIAENGIHAGQGMGKLIEHGNDDGELHLWCLL